MIANGQTKWRHRSLFTFLLLAMCLCQGSGLAFAQLEGRVVGGKAAAANSAPFIVSMQYGGTHYCAANIVNSNWLVTAAHCLANKNQVLGSTLVAGSIAVAGTASTTQKRQVTHYVVNDLYTGGTVPYDIGLIYTPTAFTWTAAVAPVKLPSSGVRPTGNADLFGWGSTSKTNSPSYPKTLQEAKKHTHHQPRLLCCGTGH